MRANTGEEALDIFKERNNIKNNENIHIILMDGTLPNISGYDAAF